MKGFKDSSKTAYVSGPRACGDTLRGAAQTAKTLKDFKTGGEPKPKR